MRITVDGKLGKRVTAKDVALYMMSKMTTSGATGYFVEYAGEAVRGLTMEGRLTLCNLSIEMVPAAVWLLRMRPLSSTSKDANMLRRVRHGTRHWPIGKH